MIRTSHILDVNNRVKSPISYKYCDIVSQQKSFVSCKSGSPLNLGSRMWTFNLLVWSSLVAWLANVNSSIAQQGAIVSENQGSNEIAPYLLFTQSNHILLLYMNETTPRILLNESGASAIIAVDYHYRSNQVFWLTNGVGLPATLKCATLDGSFLKNETILVNIGRQNNPIDLAVDWINDKVYWTESSPRQIRVYDLRTKQHSLFREFGKNDIQPASLSVLPVLNDGHIYMLGHIDSQSVSLFKFPINGTGHTVLRDSIRCDGGITIDISTHNVYWNDFCNHILETVKTDGTGYAWYNAPTSGVSPGIALFDNIFYWVQGSKLFAADFISSRIIDGSRVLYDSRQTLAKLQVVHPSKQPGIVIVTPLPTEQSTTEAEEIITPEPSSSSITSSSSHVPMVTSSLATPISSTPLPLPESTSVITMSHTSTQSVFEATTSSMVEVRPTSSVPSPVDHKTSSSLMSATPTPVVKPNEEMFESQPDNIQLLIIILPVVVGLIIITTILCIVLILIYCKYRRTRKGSYTVKQVVQTRPHKQRQATQAAKLNRVSAASDFFWQEAPTSPSARSSGVTSSSPLCLESGNVAIASPSARSSGVVSFPDREHVSSPSARSSGVASLSPLCLDSGHVGSPSARSSGVVSFSGNVGSPSARSSGVVSFSGHVGSPSARSSGVVSFSPICQEFAPPTSPSARSSGVVSFSPLLQPSDDTDSTSTGGASPIDESLKVVHI